MARAEKSPAKLVFGKQKRFHQQECDSQSYWLVYAAEVTAAFASEHAKLKELFK
jgi:hypothetical protein